VSDHLKYSPNNLGNLNRVKIFDANGKLKEIIYAKRIEENYEFSRTLRDKNKKTKAKNARKKLMASDLIEL